MAEKEKHKVETFHWIENVIKKTVYFFERVEEALHFAKQSHAHDVKVYNHEGELIHCKNHGGETYA
jgi:hypothetical protein